MTTRVGMAIMLLAGACAMPSPADPTGPRTQNTADSSSARTCDRGKPLGADQAEEWDRKWARVEAFRRDPASAGSNSPACSGVREFVGGCPNWSSDISNAYAELCRPATAKATLPTPEPEPQREGCPSGMVGNKAAGRVIRPEIDALLRVDLGLTGLKDLNPARSAVGRVKSLMRLYHCYDEDAAKDLDSRVAQWSADTEKAVADEEKCRATPACMAKRRAPTAAGSGGGDRCAACARERASCMASVEAGRFPEGAICDSAEGARQCCDIAFIQCSNGQCGRVTK